MTHVPGHGSYITGGTNQFGNNPLTPDNFNGDFQDDGSGLLNALSGFNQLGGGQQQQGNAFSRFFQSPTFEAINSGLGTFSTLANIYGGFKSLGLSKDSLRFQKDSFNKNFNAQAQDYNNTLRDRWAARSAGAAARGRTFASEADFLAGRQIQKA